MAKKHVKDERDDAEARADAQTGITRANVNRETVDAAQFVSLYVNDTQIQLTPWDVRLILGIVTDPPSAERQTVLVKTLGEIRMSPQHAKRMAIVLMQQLKHYEAAVGAIPLPNDD
jgi:hypothetical protein